MKLFFNRFFILMKRSLKQPVNLVMLLVLLLLAIIYRSIPASEKSMYIPVAILCEDEDPRMKESVGEMTKMNSIFHFYTVQSEEELYQEISSRNANTGILIPKGFLAQESNSSFDKKVLLYTTPSSLLTTMIQDSLFSHIFRLKAIDFIHEYISGSQLYQDLDMSKVLKQTDTLYTQVRNSSEIFRLEDSSGGVYNEITREDKLDIPVRKLAGLFILTAGLLGISTYLRDSEERLYLRMRGMERYSVQLLHIVSCILPMALISWPVIWITEGGNGLYLLGRVAVYTLICVTYAFILSLIIRKSTIYQKVLPVLLVLAILLGGVIFDLTDSSTGFFRILSMCMPVYYF